MENYGLEALKVLEESPPQPRPRHGILPCLYVCVSGGRGWDLPGVWNLWSASTPLPGSRVKRGTFTEESAWRGPS